MNEKIMENYFPIAKLIYIFSLIIYFIATNVTIIYERSILEISLLFIFTSATLFYELLDKKSIILLILCLSICIILIFNFQSFYSVLIPIVALDLITYFGLPSYLYLLTFLIVLQKDNNRIIYFIACLCCNIMYFQHYYIINAYKAILTDFTNTEEDLKTSIEKQRMRHKNDIEKFTLALENKSLEERSRLSQALHDKIGHSINGSVYQLEACKLLIKDNPLDSKKIIQAVIDNLRKSLDEIRAILRKEKPNKGQLSLIQLRKLCENFKENYNINAKIVCSGEINEVPEHIWEIILNNSIEAFSNALKYSGCKNIKINIVILNKLVRCSIEDDGRGCSNIKEGMGLTGMKERTKAANGNIFITSNLGFEIKEREYSG
ncbi:sensor histidine kinase [Clostridium pasteurianum]|uniref:histidine kinase n=1 Tax=Clostridium pasteurianum BC1 TaxID=86416 RepID=R4KC46_CLOPA|nr:histidine kinase [Clostridium pasteurianum]AGK98089.1 signal transduction histidine kinase [Clostridium pasteurianum BC1]